MDRDTRADYAPHCAFRYSKIALGGQLRRFSKRKKRLLTRFTTFKLAHPRTPHGPRVGSVPIFCAIVTIPVDLLSDTQTSSLISSTKLPSTSIKYPSVASMICRPSQPAFVCSAPWPGAVTDSSHPADYRS